MKKTAFLILLLLIILFIAWSFLQPSGILSTIQNNLWSVNSLKLITNASDQVNLPAPSSVLPHAAILTARQALRQDQPEKANQLILPLLSFSDRAVQGTYAEVLYAIGNKTQAISIWESLNDTLILERVARDDPEGGPESVLAAIQSLYNLDPEKYTSSLAFELKTQNRLAEAAEILHTSRQRYPGSQYASNWLRYLADIYTAQQNWQQAEQVYLHTVAENPQDQRAWRNLGLMYMSSLNMPEKALECFQKLVEFSPNEPYGYSLLAQAYEKSGKPQEALLTYRQLLLISPDDPTALQAIDHLTNQLQTP